MKTKYYIFLLILITIIFLNACVDDTSTSSTTANEQSSNMSITDMTHMHTTDMMHMHTDHMTLLDANTPILEMDAEMDAEINAEMDLGMDAILPLIDIGPPLPRLDPEFVMNQIQLLSSRDGFDLNEDGVADNGLALLFEDPFVCWKLWKQRHVRMVPGEVICGEQ